MCSLVLKIVSFLLACPTFDCLLVLVNRVKIAQVLTSTHDKIHKDVEYHYVQGDRVDVSCVRQYDVGRIRLSFDYAKQPLVDYNPDTAVPGDEWPARAVGLEIVLLEEHNHQQLSCEYEEFRDEGVATTTVNVKFILNNTDDDMFLKFNDRIFRVQNLNFIQYYYTKHDGPLSLEPVVKREVVPGTFYWKYQIGNRSVIMKKPDRIYYENLDYIMHMVFNICHPKKVCQHRRRIDMVFSQLTVYKTLGYENALKLIISTNDNNIVMTSYRWFGDSLLYYQYDDGHSQNFTCTVAGQLMSTGSFALNYDGMLTKADSITQLVQLGTAGDRSPFVCSLLLLPEVTVRKINVVFQLKPKPVTMPVTTTIKTTILATTSASTTTTILIKTTTTAPVTTTSLATASTSSVATTNHPETSSTPETAIIIVIVMGAAFIALAVACMIWYLRRKQVCVTTTGHPLIENDATAPVMEHHHGTADDNHYSTPYAYVYVTREETVTTVPQRPRTLHGTEPSAHPEAYRPPLYDYAYGISPQQPYTCHGAKSPEQSRNSLDSDYTDHYTEIDEYFIQKQMEKSLKRKQKRPL